MGRRRDEVSMFELLRDPGKTREAESKEAPESKDPGSLEKDRDAGSRKKVALDDRAKKIPVVRRLPPIPTASSSASTASSETTPSVDRSLLAEVVEVRIVTILVFVFAAFVVAAIAFIAGRSFAVVTPPSGMNELMQDTPPWPVIDPQPDPRPAIRNVVQDGVVDPEIAPEPAEAGGAEGVPVVAALPKTLWSVMIGQHLSKDPQVIDQLVRYVDSGLSLSQARVRVSTSRGARTFSVFVGPFEEQDQARSALREIQSLRPYLGVRFRDAYPTRMVFTPDEIESYGGGF